MISQQKVKVLGKATYRPLVLFESNPLRVKLPKVKTFERMGKGRVQKKSMTFFILALTSPPLFFSKDDEQKFSKKNFNFFMCFRTFWVGNFSFFGVKIYPQNPLSGGKKMTHCFPYYLFFPVWHFLVASPPPPLGWQMSS